MVDATASGRLHTITRMWQLLRNDIGIPPRQAEERKAVERDGRHLHFVLGINNGDTRMFRMTTPNHLRRLQIEHSVAMDVAQALPPPTPDFA
jgi:hypothetical protein